MDRVATPDTYYRDPTHILGGPWEGNDKDITFLLDEARDGTVRLKSPPPENRGVVLPYHRSGRNPPTRDLVLLNKNVGSHLATSRADIHREARYELDAQRPHMRVTGNRYALHSTKTAQRVADTISH